MCLSKIDEIAQPFEQGWKKFRKIGNELFPMFSDRKKPLPIGVWLKASDFTPSYEDAFRLQSPCGAYDVGFHVFAEKNDAHTFWKLEGGFFSGGASPGRLTTYKVLCRNMNATGIGDTGTFPCPSSAKVGVCQEMFIVEEDSI